MSTHVTSPCWKQSSAKGSTRLVLLSLADQANDDGWCWPSVAAIAKRCAISERSVQDHLNRLCDAGGLLEVERVERPGRSTQYRVLWGWEGAEERRAELRRQHAAEQQQDTTQGGADSAGVQNLRPAGPAPGGAAHRGGGVQDSAPRTVREPSPNRQGAQQRARRLPDDWTPLADVVAQMRQECPAIDQDLELRKFRDHWSSLGGQRGCKLDWTATYRNWIRNSTPPRGQLGAQPGYRQTDEQIRQERLARAGDLIPPAHLGGYPAAERAWLRAARQRIADGLPLDDIGDAA